MTNSNSNRDDELETIRQLLIATVNRTESNDESIIRLTNKLDQYKSIIRLTNKLDQSIDHLTNKLDRSIDHLINRLDNLLVKVEQTTSDVDNLTATVNQIYLHCISVEGIARIRRQAESRGGFNSSTGSQRRTG